jgi:hypothetical protein
MFKVQNMVVVSPFWHNVGLNHNIKHLTMKASTSTTVILKSIDLELKKLLQQDLAAFKAKQQSATKQANLVKQAA